MLFYLSINFLSYVSLKSPIKTKVEIDLYIVREMWIEQIKSSLNLNLTLNVCVYIEIVDWYLGNSKDNLRHS